MKIRQKSIDELLFCPGRLSHPDKQRFFTTQEEKEALTELQTLLPPLHLVLGVGESSLRRVLTAVEASREKQIKIARSNLLKGEGFIGTKEFLTPKQRFEVLRDLCSLEQSMSAHRLAAKVCLIVAAILFVLAWIFLPWSALALPVLIALLATSAHTGLRALNVQYDYDKGVRELGRQEVLRAQEAIDSSPIEWLKKEAVEICSRSDAPQEKVSQTIDTLYKSYVERYAAYPRDEKADIDLRKVVHYLFSAPLKEYEERFASLRSQGDLALRRRSVICSP